VTAEPEFLYLTTTGRRTGTPREIEIWFTRHAGCYYVVAEHGERAHWVQNLRAEPRVQVRVGADTFAARARVVSAAADAGLAREVRKLSQAKYGWGDGLVVELEPRDPEHGRGAGPSSSHDRARCPDGG
jgi:deazaflavin-dependent oxidoreductase (nitroreductase family)